MPEKSSPVRWQLKEEHKVCQKIPPRLQMRVLCRNFSPVPGKSSPGATSLEEEHKVCQKNPPVPRKFSPYVLPYQTMSQRIAVHGKPVLCQPGNPAPAGWLIAALIGMHCVAWHGLLDVYFQWGGGEGESRVGDIHWGYSLGIFIWVIHGGCQGTFRNIREHFRNISGTIPIKRILV